MGLKNFVERFGAIKLFLLATGLFFFIFYGVSIFLTPSYEVMYTHRLLPVTPIKQGEMHIHILELGNTGRNSQEKVDILLASSIMAFEAIPLAVRNFGKVDRNISISDNGNITRIALGALEPEKRVELRLCLFFENANEVHEWDDFFKGIEIEQGKTVAGDPKWTTLGRFFYNIFGAFF